CGYPVHCIRRGLVVVRQVASRDAFLDPTAATAPYLTHYAYEDPASDLSGRGFLGFGLMREWDPQRPSETTWSFSAHKTRVDGSYSPGVERPATVTTATPILAPNVNRRGSTVTTRVVRTANTYELRHLNSGHSFAIFPATSVERVWEQNATLTTGALSPATP